MQFPASKHLGKTPAQLLWLLNLTWEAVTENQKALACPSHPKASNVYIYMFCNRITVPLNTNDRLIEHKLSF